MHAANAKRNLILLLIAIILSFGIFRQHGAPNVSFCIYTAGCTWDETVNGQKRIGDVSVHDFGFPLTYRHTEEFTYTNTPNPHQNGETGTTTAHAERPSFSLPSVAINIIFWFALLHLLDSWNVFRPRQKASASKDFGAPAQPVAKE